MRGRDHSAVPVVPVLYPPARREGRMKRTKPEKARASLSAVDRKSPPPPGGRSSPEAEDLRGRSQSVLIPNSQDLFTKFKSSTKDARLFQDDPGRGHTWMQDEEAKECTLCSAAFTMLKRRHHCRSCGKVVCGECSGSRVMLNVMGASKRVCTLCYHEIQRQTDAKRNGLDQTRFEGRRDSFKAIAGAAQRSDSEDRVLPGETGGGAAADKAAEAAGAGARPEEGPREGEQKRASDIDLASAYPSQRPGGRGSVDTVEGFGGSERQGSVEIITENPSLIKAREERAELAELAAAAQMAQMGGGSVKAQRATFDKKKMSQEEARTAPNPEDAASSPAEEQETTEDAKTEDAKTEAERKRQRVRLRVRHPCQPCQPLPALQA